MQRHMTLFLMFSLVFCWLLPDFEAQLKSPSASERFVVQL
jgi:hypothetical protein